MSEEQKKFQWSKFSPDRSEQFVIRTDSYDDLLDYRARVLGVVPKEKAFPDDEGNMATPPEKTQQAVPIHHGKPMTKGKWGWYCKTKLPDGTWCKYQPVD